MAPGRSSSLFHVFYTFGTVIMTDDFRALLRSKKLSEQAIEALAANGLDTLESLQECSNDDLIEAGLKLLGDRKKVLALAGAGQYSPPHAVAEENPQAFDTNAFLQQLSSSGLNLSSIKPRINVEFANRAADSVLAYIIVSTGILDVFDSAFWASIMLEDMQLRTRIHSWKERTRTQQYISNIAKDELLSSVPKLFSGSFDSLILTARTMSAQLEASDMLGAQARINIGGDATGLVALRDLIPLAAEGLSNAMIASEMPEQALSVVSMINDLVSLIKEPLLLANAGVLNYDSSDEGAIIYLTKRFGPEIANKFRLALAYEQCVRAIAACPATAEINRDYLQVVGMLAGRLCTYFTLVLPGSSEEIQPFSQLKNLMRKAAEPVGQKQTDAKIAGAPSTGWPFPKFGNKVKDRSGCQLPMVISPKVDDFAGCTLPLVIVGSGDFAGCTITTLIWFGDGRGGGELCGCNVSYFYCLPGDEPDISGGNVPMPQYKTRDELIALAVELAQQRNVQIL
jgi:hypothetical protein